MPYISTSPVTVEGGSVQVIVPHTVDGDTLHHWPLDGSGADGVGSLDFTTATLNFMRLNGLVSNTRQGAYNATEDQGYTASGAGALAVFDAITVAAWVMLMRNPTSNMPIIGMRNTSSGSINNTPWAMDVTSTGLLRWFWQSGVKVNQEIFGATTLPLNTWIHVIGTRNAAGTAGAVYLNGVSDGSGSGLTTADGASNQTILRLLSKGATEGLNAGVVTPIIKDVEVNGTQALALYQSTLGTQAV